MPLERLSQLAIAHRLRDRYHFSLVPVQRRSKRPALPAWAEFQHRHPTDAELAAWFAADVNVGIVTGSVSQLVIIDLDDEEARAWAARTLPATPMRVRTGGGGEHWYYVHPGGLVRNLVRVHRLAIDLRADGGFVVAPGSVHASGQRYRAPEPWPASLATVPTFNPTWVREPAPPPSPPRVLVASSARLAVVGLGRAARRMDAGLDSGESQERGPLRHRTMGRAAMTASPWTPEPGAFEPDELAGLTTLTPLIGYTLVELALLTFPERKPVLLRGDTVIFRAGHIGQIYAERGVGKTWFAQTLGLVAATGCTALGFSAPSPCRVLYIDGEMGSEEIQQRFLALENRLGVTPPATLTVVGADWQPDFLPRLDTALGQALIEPFVAAADLIILDNRSMLFDPDGEKDPSAWQPAQDWLLSLRRRGKGRAPRPSQQPHGRRQGHQQARRSDEFARQTRASRGLRAETGCSISRQL